MTKKNEEVLLSSMGVFSHSKEEWDTLLQKKTDAILSESISLKEKNLDFLMELQKELNEQPFDCQAAPRFWVIKDYRWVPGNPEYDDCEVSYFYNDGDFTEFKNVEELEEFLEEHYNLSQHFRNNFGDNGYDFKELWEWSLENLNEDRCFSEVPSKKESYIVPNTMFLTKADAINHLNYNAHHYTSDAHTYAMTAWRSPKVEELMKILESFDWESFK